jgi:hypothetical protein
VTSCWKTVAARATRASHVDAGGNQQAFLVEFSGAKLAAHFHHVRQFQVIVAGDGGRVGKAAVPPISFHYTDPDSPYGPIVPGPSGSISFFTLRPRASKGTFYMPGSRDRMSAHAGRNVVVQVPRIPPLETESVLEELIHRHDDGLAAHRLRLARRAVAPGPELAGSGGQYYLLYAGSLLFDAREVRPHTLGWVEPDEKAPVLRAGDNGADVLVLQFPVASAVEAAGLLDEVDAPQFSGDGPRIADAQLVSI